MSASSSSPDTPASARPLEAAQPRCRHFGECGGCRLQDIAYESQLVKKAQTLEVLMGPLGWTSPIVVHPSPQAWYYRNKMEFSFQDVYPAPPPGEDHLRLGLKQRNRWDKVMNLSECHLLSPEAPRLLDSVHAWARAEGLEPYNLHRQVGFLRHLVVREGKNTGERMVNLLTSPGKLPAESFLKAVRDAYPASTVLRGVHAEKADVAVSSTVDVLFGPGHIREKILGRSFRISPYSFFQTNTRGAELLYELLRAQLKEVSPKNLLDLYCGGGGISLSVADLCERVMGVEVVASAVDDARANAASNGVKNCEFMAAKVEDLLPSLAAQSIDVDTVVVDPPRSGLHPAAVTALKELAPTWILYVSCNPKALAEDIRRLAGLYDVRSLQGVDLFPHTDHLEAVALLRAVF